MWKNINIDLFLICFEAVHRHSNGPWTIGLSPMDKNPHPVTYRDPARFIQNHHLNQTEYL
jgi:hypothetical protein